MSAPSSSSSPSPALIRHPLSSPSSRPPPTDISNSWILEFVLRQPIPNSLAHQIFLSLPFSSFHSHLRKSLLLHRLASETHSSSLSERALHSLELIEEHDRIRGAPPSNRLKAAYCAVAVSCTAAARRRGSDDFADAVKRIWKTRIEDVVGSEAAPGLVSGELVEWAERIERCVMSGEGGEELFDGDVEEGMALVRDYLNEAAEEMGPSFLEIAAAEGKDNGMDEGQCVGKSEGKGESLEDEPGVLGDDDDASTKEGCYGADGFQLDPVVEVEDEEGCVNLGGHDMSDPGGGLNHKLVPGEVSEVKEALRNSRLELQMMVEDPLPEAEIAAAAALLSISSGIAFLNEPAKRSSRGNAVLPASVIEPVAEVPAGSDTSTGALVKAKCNLVPLPDFVNRDSSENGIKDAEPSKRKDILVRHTFFERNQTDYTSELSDDSLHLAKSTDLSPKPKSKRTFSPRLGDRKLVKRRAAKRWTSLEENTLREAVAKHGKGNWKLILSYNDEIFEGRTEVDLKDKWRNMSRYLLQV